MNARPMSDMNELREANADAANRMQKKAACRGSHALTRTQLKGS